MSSTQAEEKDTPLYQIQTRLSYKEFASELAESNFVTVGGGSARLCEVAQNAELGDRDCRGTDEAGDFMTKLKRLMGDPEFREECKRGGEESALVLVRARAPAKLTQVEVARRVETTQSAIARLEGGLVSPSFATLRRYAEATATRLTVGMGAGRRLRRAKLPSWRRAVRVDRP